MAESNTCVISDEQGNHLATLKMTVELAGVSEKALIQQIFHDRVYLIVGESPDIKIGLSILSMLKMKGHL